MLIEITKESTVSKRRTKDLQPTGGTRKIDHGKVFCEVFGKTYKIMEDAKKVVFKD
ncbi:uncharacterized protein G2W53_015961 [Senna tora]|uniref:Uncharacterized protein n=1 Tax=Senna tora TaxID=362788 RepID=A0A834WWJ3_9FABA|nr:uncharacterized protein G2W53_015961 [Senna tora]